MGKYIGNVIVNSPNYKIDSYYKKCLSIDNVDPELPTLIISMNKAKEIISNFNILKKSYYDGLICWTFSKSERRVDYDKDIENFYHKCINNIINNIKYYNININNLKYNKIKNIIKYINNKDKKLYYIDNNKFIFLYDFENSKYVFGFSLNTTALLGVNKEKILKLIKNNPENINIPNFFTLPNTIRQMVEDDIPKELVLFEYFND